MSVKTIRATLHKSLKSKALDCFCKAALFLKTFVKSLYSVIWTNLILLYLFGDLVVNLMEIVVKYLLYYSEEDIMFLMEKL